jgi:hypothetical protein
MGSDWGSTPISQAGYQYGGLVSAFLIFSMSRTRFRTSLRIWLSEAGAVTPSGRGVA